MTNDKILAKSDYEKILTQIQNLVFANKEMIQNYANSILALTYWEVGKILEEQKITQSANYQTLILNDLERDLEIEKTTLRRCVQFFNAFPKKPQQTNLTWSHYKSLIAVKDDNFRQLATKMAAAQNWTTTKLRNEIARAKNGAALALENENGAPQNAGKPQIKRPTTPNYLYKATIFDVVDGDTLILDIDLGFQVIKRQRIRLAQINAPEISTKEGQESFEFLRDLCAGLGQIVVKTNKVDIYGRFLGDIFFLNEEEKRGQDQLYFFENGVYLSAYLVEKGVAGVF